MSTKVQIGDLEVTLQDRESAALALDLLAAAQDSPHRAQCAALGMAWLHPRTGRPKTTYERCGFNALRYGGAILDELVRDGHDWQAVIRAGGPAFELLTAHAPLLEEAAEAEGFTDPTEEP